MAGSPCSGAELHSWAGSIRAVIARPFLAKATLRPGGAPAAAAYGR